MMAVRAVNCPQPTQMCKGCMLSWFFQAHQASLLLRMFQLVHADV